MNSVKFESGRVRAGRDHLIFDGDCGICARFSELARRLDSRNRFVIAPYQSFPEDELARFGLDYTGCSRGAQAISGGGRVHSGAFAINYFLWRHPLLRILVLVVYLAPVLLLVELVIYRLVAGNRQLFSRLLGINGCGLGAGPASRP